MQIKSLIIASVMLTSFMAAPLQVQAEVRVVPPTVVSKVYRSKEEKAAKLAERLALQKAARLAAKPRVEKVVPRQAIKIADRNQRVTVQYRDGSIKENVKYKTVEQDVEKGSAIVIA